VKTVNHSPMLKIYLISLAIPLGISGCMTNGAMPSTSQLFGENACNFNQTAIGTAAGAVAGAILGRATSSKEDAKKGILVGAAGGAGLGWMLGSKADLECQKQAQTLALNNAAKKYEEAQRQLAAAETATQQANATAAAAKAAEQRAIADAQRKSATPTVAASGTASKVTKPTKQQTAKTAQAAPDNQAEVTKQQYEEIVWTAASGAKGSVVPLQVFPEATSDRLCTTFQDTVNDKDGNPVASAPKTSCRNANGEWIPVA
jgi:hypothetical protein